MPRIRTIKPDFFTSDVVSQLPFRTRLTWVGIWTYCDDKGRCRDNAKLIKAAVWPLDEVSAEEVEEDLEILAKHGLMQRYELDGKHYLQVSNWKEHQKINNPTGSKLPPPPGVVAETDDEVDNEVDEDEELGSSTVELHEDPSTAVVSEKEEEREKDKKTRPQLTLLSDSTAEKPDNLARFSEFYAAYPRRVQRRAAEKAWVAAVRRKVDPQVMIDAAARYAQLKRDTEIKYVKYPASWINAGGYDDEPETVVRKNPNIDPCMRVRYV